MKQVDLKPTEYRDLTRRQRFVSSRLFMWLATVCGAWAATILYFKASIFTLATIWWFIPAAFAPAVLLFIAWLMLGGEDHHR